MNRPPSNGRYTPPQRSPIISMSAGLDFDEHMAQHLASIGCCCDYEVEVVDRDGFRHATIAHDEWCPVLMKIDAGSN